MKKYKLYLFYILILMFLYEIITSYLIMQIESNALAPEKFNNLSSLSKNYNRIVLGDSRSHQAIDPKVLDLNSSYTTYNLAAPGMQTPFMYYITERYIKYNKPPKQIIVNMSFYLLGGNQWMKDIYFKHYVPTISEAMDSYSYQLNYVFTDALLWYFKTHIPSLKHEGRITRALSDFTKIPGMYRESFKLRKVIFDESYQGYLPRGYHHIDDEIKLGEWTTKLHLGYSIYITYMRRFFELSKKYNFKIYVYEFPWPVAYKKSKNHKIVHKFYTNMIKEIVSDYSNVHYLENDHLFLNHKYFIDPLHLNNLGAELLSKQLKKELNRQ